MKKIKAFNFIELLMVMFVLGIIISLTMPLIKDLKNSDSIHRSYMKKALQDVSDAYTMSLMRNNIPGLDRLVMIASIATTSDPNASLDTNCKKLRYLFNTAINGLECGVSSGDANYKLYTNDAGNNKCVTTAFVAGNVGDAPDVNAPGIVIGGKSTMVFVYDNAVAGQYGYVYVDMNGNKSPNTICEDRFRFILYKNYVSLDMNDSVWGCKLEIQDYGTGS